MFWLVFRCMVSISPRMYALLRRVSSPVHIGPVWIWMMCFPLKQLPCFLTDDVYTISHRGWSIISLVRASLMALFSLGWSASVCVSVWGYPGCPSDCYLTFFPPHSISLVLPFRMEEINATGALSLSSWWRILHCQCRIFLFSSQTKEKWLPAGANRPHEMLTIEQWRRRRMTSRRSECEHRIL